jgi:hypothetical protein
MRLKQVFVAFLVNPTVKRLPTFVAELKHIAKIALLSQWVWSWVGLLFPLYFPVEGLQQRLAWQVAALLRVAHMRLTPARVALLSAPFAFRVVLRLGLAALLLQAKQRGLPVVHWER